MECADFKTHCAAYLDANVPGELDAAMNQHLNGCPDCSAFIMTAIANGHADVARIEEMLRRIVAAGMPGAPKPPQTPA